ncbi:lipopolysaccharide biosynthesis protein [uncultured Bacteroides sp.]|uniref:lipopolysaccharide biosynthesis protein n=1 Tax=uncultured Bacteroides sp. TaxID=162156 RepID=UPI00280A58B4|nr:lipopolysaccharide biosynthesis protein [uncultured Bacteroides sp.]
MTSQSENTKRIAKNTLMLYVRMLFGMLVSLYTSRVVLQALGVEDYGIYNVVGGVVAMFSMISSSLSSSVSRFLTFELGRGNVQRLIKVFSTSLCIHFVLAGVILLLAESIGVWFLNNYMTIPANRLCAANWVFQASLLAFMFGLFSVPYNASIVAHEKMTAFAYIGILDIVLRLCVILFVAYSPFLFDRLIVYSLLLVIVGVSMQMIYCSYCQRHFEECHFQLNFDRESWKAMSTFAGWNFIGCTASLLKDQGVNVLLNLFGGPLINAARGIANSVNTLLSSFSANFMTALNPQITKSYAARDYDYMFSLVERGSRFSYYILLIFALPVLFETDFILTLWLKNYPEHTVNFVRLILLITLCDILSNTLINLQLATGKLRNYQLAVGGMLLMNFPLSYLCLKKGFPPESVLIVAIGVAVCCLFLRLFFLRKMVGLSVRHYLLSVCGNVLIVTIMALIFPTIIALQVSDGLLRFFLICIVSVVSTMFSIYRIGCTSTERNFIRDKMFSVIRKIF